MEDLKLRIKMVEMSYTLIKIKGSLDVTLPRNRGLADLPGNLGSSIVNSL